MNREATIAYFRSLAGLKGQVDGRNGEWPCDLSGAKPGCPTATDIIDQLEADVAAFRGAFGNEEKLVLPEEARQEVLNSYAESYNRVARRERYG
jgi:metal-sulfur cluster biosynthetic enzyme